MKRHAWKRIAVAALAVALTSAASLSIAQENTKSSAKSEGASQSETQKESRGGPQEGIKVHGHWRIVVKNADGSVASHHEFENALSSNGAYNLSSFLVSGTGVTPKWFIDLFFTNNTPGGNALQSYPATAALATNGPPAMVMSLSGAKVPVGYGPLQITNVQTEVATYGQSESFTIRDLTKPVPPSTTPPPPIVVQDGQTVDVTVTISFS